LVFRGLVRHKGSLLKFGSTAPRVVPGSYFRVRISQKQISSIVGTYQTTARLSRWMTSS
jgi:hypothetical protein